MNDARVVAPPTVVRHALLAALLVALAASSCTSQVTPTASPDAPSSSAAATINESSTPASTSAAPSVPGPCQNTALSVRVTQWEGAAGSRIGSVELANEGTSTCLVFALARPQLIDGSGSVLVEGGQPAVSPALEVVPGGTLSAAVQVSNYCGPVPVAPVTLAFDLPDGLGRITAVPLSSTDIAGVPPCNGSTGSPGTIEMKPWTP